MTTNPQYTAAMLPACEAALDKLAQIEQAATAGPWQHCQRCADYGVQTVGTGHADSQPICRTQRKLSAAKPDMAFIATARTALPALLAYGRGLLKRLAEAEAAWAAGDSWWCPHCQEWCDGKVVTYQEEHDRRYGGCGNTVLDRSHAPCTQHLDTLRAEADELLAALRGDTAQQPKALKSTWTDEQLRALLKRSVPHIQADLARQRQLLQPGPGVVEPAQELLNDIADKLQEAE